MSQKAERRPGSGEIWLAVTKHDGVQVDSILIDQAKFGEALRQARALTRTVRDTARVDGPRISTESRNTPGPPSLT